MRSASIVSCLALLVFTASPLALHAQGFPNKPLRLIVPYPPGGPTDILGRVLAHKMTQEMGQSVLIENRPGAGGTIGADLAAKAPADGHTLLFGTSGTHGSAPAFYPKLTYDPIKSFNAISLLINAPLFVIANGAVPVKTLGELIGLAKSKPGQLSYGSGNLGGNIVGEMFKIQTGTDMLHVPYKGVAPAMTDLLAGRVQLMFDIQTAFSAYMGTGKVKPLAITAPKRIGRLPDVPTTAEAGLPGFEYSVWFAMFTSRGAPRDVLQRLNTEVLKALAAKDVQEAFAKQGMDPAGSSPEQLEALVAAEIPKWTRAVQASGAKVE